MTALPSLLKQFHNNHYVYNLHQKNGFTCMLLGEIFELVYVSYQHFFVVLKIFYMRSFFLLAVSCCLWLASQFSSPTAWIMTSFLPTSLSITSTRLKSPCLMPSCLWMSAMPGKSVLILLTVLFVKRWQFYC